MFPLHLYGEEKIEIERKFLLSYVKFPENLKVERYKIKQSYINDLKGIGRVRRMESKDDIKYYYTIKKSIEVGKNLEIEREISIEDYLFLLKEIDQSRVEIEKERFVFEWEKVVYEIDIFKSPVNFMVLEVEGEHQELKFPDFIRIEREVTGDKMFSNKNIAKKNYEMFKWS